MFNLKSEPIVLWNGEYVTMLGGLQLSMVSKCRDCVSHCCVQN
jgi:hypothetical protein